MWAEETVDETYIRRSLENQELGTHPLKRCACQSCRKLRICDSLDMHP
jgi:hypothetical protein